ncbi:MAG: gentisate 1,2-dioxygenase [Chloroflexi bacterium]|nr:gentisate 1,2-dioxygenase [Chloroflexota bacterium]
MGRAAARRRGPLFAAQRCDCKPCADRAPIPRPPKLLCAIGNYGERPKSDSPTEVDFTFKSPESIIGPGDTVVLADVAATGFEAEATLGVVIGRDAKKMPESDALSCVLGYTAFLDVFATGLGRNIGTFFGKSLDTLGPMGPCIVTVDESIDPRNLRIRLIVNGKTQQDFTTADMLMPAAGVLATATAIMTLHPGDVVTCGSPVEGRVLLKDGDEATVEIDGIGRFSVQVSDPARRVWAA